MHIHEFELRYSAFAGLSTYLKLGWTQEHCVNLVKITNRGVPSKKIQELTPVELKEITQETYTQFKHSCIEKNTNEMFGDFPVSEYIERLEYELKVIKEMGFNSYFLIVSDFVKWSKANNIVVGPGRGSGAGSLLAWVTAITDVNPLPYGLLFERFLNPARVSMPDFDIDFEDTLREKVIEYVTEKYGKENVCAIGTYMKMATKAAFKDTARATGIPFDMSNMISRLIPEKMNLAQAMESTDTPEELKQLYETDEKVKNAVTLSAQLEGNMRQLGVHACGIIVSPDPVWTYTPVQYVQGSHDTLVSQYDGPSLENIGLLKMDFLGLRNLSVIKNCINIISKKAENEGTELPAMMTYFLKTMSFQPPLDDMTTFEKVFQAGDTTGIFQFEGDGMRRFLVKLKADSINDLVAMNALYRPGPLEFIPNYIARKHGEEQISYMSEELRDIITKKYDAETADNEEKKLVQDLAPIMNITYGIAVYQEQLMFLVQAMVGFSLAEADNLRRGVGKKKKEVIEQIKKEFVERGAQHRDYKPETCLYIYEKMIEPAANYSFNKSHSVCYALIAYQTAYLKAHYTTEFYAALIRSVEEDTDTLSHYIYEAQTHGIVVLQADVNNSFTHVAAIKDHIRLGFFCMKGIGIEVAEQIQEERKKAGNYKDLEDFLTRCKNIVNKKSLESLIKGGGFDSFGDRKTLLTNIESLLQWTKSSQTMSQGLFGGDAIHSKIQFKENFTTSPMEKLMMEQEVFKSFVSSNPFDGLYPYIKKFGFISQFQGEETTGPFQFIGIITGIQRAKKKGFFLQIEDISGNIEFFMKDVLDLKKFDIVIASGFKGSRSPSIDKLIKISHEELVKRTQTANKYDPIYTYAHVKKLRGSEEKPSISQETESITPPVIKEESPTKIDSPIITEQPSVEKSSDNFSFALPENIAVLSKLIHLIKSHPGEKKILIGDKEYLIDEGIIEDIEKLL